MPGKAEGEFRTRGEGTGETASGEMGEGGREGGLERKTEVKDGRERAARFRFRVSEGE